MGSESSIDFNRRFIKTDENTLKYTGYDYIFDNNSIIKTGYPNRDPLSLMLDITREIIGNITLKNTNHRIPTLDKLSDTDITNNWLAFNKMDSTKHKFEMDLISGRVIQKIYFMNYCKDENPYSFQSNSIKKARLVLSGNETIGKKKSVMRSDTIEIELPYYQNPNPIVLWEASEYVSKSQIFKPPPLSSIFTRLSLRIKISRIYQDLEIYLPILILNFIFLLNL